jgi:alternate signal-mediated exported protein
MNKLVKSSIAGAAGIALLLGGLGSFALWSDTTTVAAGAINSGELEIVEAATPGSWAFSNGTKLSTASHIVPGDVVEYEAAFTVNAKGDNLRAKLTDNVKSLVSTIEGATVSSTYVVSGGAVQDPDDERIYAFDEGTYPVTVTITVFFESATTGLTGQNEEFTPGAVNVLLEQVRVPIPAP